MPTRARRSSVRRYRVRRSAGSTAHRRAVTEGPGVSAIRSAIGRVALVPSVALAFAVLAVGAGTVAAVPPAPESAVPAMAAAARPDRQAVDRAERFRAAVGFAAGHD